MRLTTLIVATVFAAAMAGPALSYGVEPADPTPQRVAFAAPEKPELALTPDTCTLPQEIDLQTLLALDPRLLTGPQPGQAPAVACAAE